MVPDIEVLDTLLTRGRATHQHTPAVYSVCKTESIETECEHGECSEPNVLAV
jgi:hypothetical protein